VVTATGNWTSRSAWSASTTGARRHGVRLGMECLLQALEACRRLGHRPDICLEDGLLGGRGANALRQPAPVGWSPGGLARRAEILAQEQGVEPIRRRLEVAESLFTGATQVTHGVVFELWDIDRDEIARAYEPGQLSGVSAIGCDSIAGVFRHQRGRHHPTALALLRQIALEPRAARAGLVATHEVCTLGLERAEQLIEVTRPRPEGAEGDDLRALCLGHRGDRDRVLRDIPSHRERARLGHG
ncbi:MAG TPA: hypothetical protein VGC99_18825, partial [Candidatus Tectomicrobia bacterium]